MDSVLRALRSPGAMRAVSGVAPPAMADSAPGDCSSGSTSTDDGADTPGYIPQKKAGFLDRSLDSVVRASGSILTFSVIQGILVAWAFLGIPFHDHQLWPIFISDAQAIFTYAFDSLLMRQQMNSYTESLTVAAELRSRLETNGRMLTYVTSCLDSDDKVKLRNAARDTSVSHIRLPKESRFTKLIGWSAAALGHIVFVAVYWACIIIWISFGPSNDWSNQWQLYINSSTSALMVFIFSFLAILRERHADYMRSCVDAIYKVDSLLEMKLRQLTGDCIENQEFIIPRPRVNCVQRAINYYADVVGTLIGIALLIIVLIVWIAIGPALHFDSNWWLLIGTYAGLIGLNDGFVLRNVQAKLSEYETPQYAALEAEDLALCGKLDLDMTTASHAHKHTVSHRASLFVNDICAHEVTVVVGVLFIFSLLIGASVMHWSETGQLLCNIPPSIVESFFMIILITGHNSADAQKRVDLRHVFERRLKLVAFVGAASELLGDRLRQDAKIEGAKRPIVSIGLEVA